MQKVLEAFQAEMASRVAIETTPTHRVLMPVTVVQNATGLEAITTPELAAELIASGGWRNA